MSDESQNSQYASPPFGLPGTFDSTGSPGSPGAPVQSPASVSMSAKLGLDVNPAAFGALPADGDALSNHQYTAASPITPGSGGDYGSTGSGEGQIVTAVK